MNNQPSLSTFFPRPQQIQPTADCLTTYATTHSLCKPIDKISDSIDPFEIANNPLQKPSVNIAQDVQHAVFQLYEIQKSIYTTLTPTQSNLLSTYHNLLVSISRYMSQAENLPQPSPAPRMRYQQTQE